MVSDPNWIMAIAAVIGLAGAGFGWLARGWNDRKSALPIALRRENRIEIINRCSEPLHIECVEANARIGIGDWIYNDYGDAIGAVYETPPVSVDWEVPPSSREFFPIYVDGPFSTTIEIVVTSSLRTISSKRITVRQSHH